MPNVPLIECSVSLLEGTISRKDSVDIRFELHNRSNTSVRVLKRGTPLEGLLTNCLIVKANGVEIPYDGKMLKRAAPTEDDFVILGPDEKRTSIVDLTDAYEIPRDAIIEVSFDDDNLFVESLDTDKRFIDTEESSSRPEVINRSLQFQTTLNAKKRTLGSQARDQLKKKSSNLLTRLLVFFNLKTPTIQGGTTSQQNTVKVAHKEAYRMVKASLINLSKTTDSNFIIWFDANDANASRVKVVNTYKKIKKALEQKAFTYDLSGMDCGPTDYAYTYKNTETIWICREFWPAPARGMSSKAGTLVHELSHACAETDDFKYGEHECKALAIRKSAKAIKNADNFEFYAESI